MCFSTAKTTLKQNKNEKRTGSVKKTTSPMTLCFSSSCVYKDDRLYFLQYPQSNQHPGCICSDQPISCCILHMAFSSLEGASSPLCMQGLRVTCFVGPACRCNKHSWVVGSHTDGMFLPLVPVFVLLNAIAVCLFSASCLRLLSATGWAVHCQQAQRLKLSLLFISRHGSKWQN